MQKSEPFRLPPARLTGAGFFLLAFPLTALSIDFGVTADYAGEYTNNARRASTDIESDVIHRPGISAVARHLGAETELNLQYGAYRRVYHSDSFDSQTVLEGSARVDWRALPDRLRFFAWNTRQEREIRIDEQRVPDNLQETQQTAMGAVLQADLLSNHHGTLTYTFTDRRADATRTNSHRHSLEGAYVIPLSATNLLQFVTTGTETDFDNPLAPDFQSVTGMLVFDRQAPRTTWGFSAGYASFERDLDRDKVKGFVGGFHATRQVGADAALGVNYNRDFRDSSLESYRDVDDLVVEDTIGDTDINEVHERQSASLTYSTRFGVNNALFALTGSRQEFQTDIGRDTDQIGSTVSVSRPIRPNLTGMIRGGYTRYEFTSGDRGDFNQYSASLGLDWQITRRLNAGADLSYTERQDQDGSNTSRDFDEWRAMIRVSYLVLGGIVGRN